MVEEVSKQDERRETRAQKSCGLAFAISDDVRELVSTSLIVARLGVCKLDEKLR